MSKKTNNATVNKFDYKSVTNTDIETLRKSLDALNCDFVTTKADVKVFDIHVGKGELLANVGGLLSRCKGFSVWLTVNDVGVRMSADYIEKYKTSKELENVAYKLKKRDNERRYSFSSLADATAFISSVVTATAKKDTAKKTTATKKRTTTKKKVEKKAV